MPALTNPRQELFCQLVKQGIPRYRAYPMAGYAANGGSPYRLHENARVKRRLAELNRSIAMKTRVTVETISSQLDEDRAFAVKVEQAGPALNATIAKAKLHGLIIDRKESGAPGDFATLTTVDEVIAVLKAELGEGAAAAIAAALAREPAEPEVEVIEPTHVASDTRN